MRVFRKNIFLIFCIIYTVLTLIYFFTNGVIPSDIMWLFLLVAIFSSILTILLIQKDEYSSWRLLVNQVIYVLIIMVVIISISYFSGWSLSFWSIAINFFVVTGLFILIKYLLFSNDQKEANAINEQLKNRRINSSK